MKKSLVALAALAATSAFAQSNVTLYGNLDQTLYHATNNGNAVNTTNSNGGTTSLWGLMGKEDLGGGLNAIFDLKAEITLATGQTASSTTAVNSATGNSSSTPTGSSANTSTAPSYAPSSNQQATLFNRGAWVGLSSAQFGTVKLGRQNDAVWEQEGRFNNTGINSFGWNNLTAAATDFRGGAIAFNGQKLGGGSPFVAGGSPFGYSDKADYNPTAAANIPFVAGVSYETPSFSGIKAKVVVGPKSAYDQSSGYWNRNSGSLTYDNGPIAIAAGLSFINGSDGNTAAKVSFIGGSYVYNQFKFTAAQQKTTYSGIWANNTGAASTAGYGDNMTVNALGVGYTMGAWEYNLGYTTLTDNTDSSYKTTQTGLSARYNFSKRTSWYVGYGHGSNQGAKNTVSVVYGGASLLGSGANATNNALLTGIRHQF